MENEIKEEDFQDKYIRLLAEFENYKKRTNKEKEDLVNNTKINMLSSILDMDNDFYYAFKNSNKKDNSGLDMIYQKLQNFLKSQGIEEIQTSEYDSDIHEVISVLKKGSDKIIEVISKGYTLNDKIFKYPKVILG